MFEKKTLGLKDLKFSIIEGVFATILLSASMAFIIPFAVHLGANSLEIGFITAFPALFAAWLQLLSVRILDAFRKRKELVIIFCFLQAMFFLPIAFVPFIFKDNPVQWLIIFYTISLVLGSLAGPIWQSWMKSLVPKKVVGSYFGFRNAIVGISSFLFFIGFGLSLKLFELHIGMVFFGIFILGAVGRLIAVWLFTKISDPREKTVFEKRTRFVGFLKNMKKTKFGYFILYASLMSFGIALTGPFVAYHYLENIGLKNDYFMYTVLISTMMISVVIGMNYWGRIVDKFGTIKTLKATSILVIFFPLLYILIRQPLPLIIVQILDGIIFSGYNLAIATFVFDYSTQKKIIRFGSYQAVFLGTAVFLGAIVSGLIQTLEINFFIISNSFYFVCLISMLFRLIVFKSLFKKVREVKKVKYVRTREIVYSVITFGPLTRMAPKISLFNVQDKEKNVEIKIKKIIEGVNNLVEKQAAKLEETVKIGSEKVKKKSKKLKKFRKNK